MRILNFGSLNIDHVYQVAHFVRPGETLSSGGYRWFCGGKGLNQSIALACAGAEVYHAGKVGADGQALVARLAEAGVDTTHVKVGPGVSGHAIIQVNAQGDNCIILHGGANRTIAAEEIAAVLAHFSEGDYLLLQNEINSVEQIMREARRRELRIAFNPAPMNDAVRTYPLELVDILVVNEVEADDLTGETDPERILSSLRARYPHAAVALTLGPEGVRYADRKCQYALPADRSVKVVDTTAAGDTFIGYFLGGLSQGEAVENSLRTALRACALCVSRPGASSSIPRKDELG